eukprot:gnl/TRDRNA2_/TRDRNA2_181085_c0_seq1.p1 gnl/TRDRNA2_/TRDRNA2_181085_c0~~gnl/TRDRNA2_/TRDRNA2_181085_c0_seq1.p1  ORF type:complete len:319 (-),score=56.11 gnl/TRDRNA2_/TRDRNA2_181085_c0_seq1:100-975(-)
MGGMKADPNESPLKTFLKGFLTGFIESVICYPTEYIKTQLQLQSKSNPEFTGILDCGKKTVAQNGFMGLYRGAAPLIVGSSFKQAARWTGYQTVADQLKDEKGNLTIPKRMVAGACGGITEAVFAVTPMETIKTRVTDDVRRGTNNYTGSLDCVMKVMKTEGPMGLYRGVAPTIAKQATNQMVRFPVQHLILVQMVGDDKEKRANPIYNGIAGAGAGAVSVILTMPQDTVKTKMQGEEAKKLYKGSLDCAMQIMKNDGPAFFFAGTWPRMIRVSLDVGITFCIFPLLSKYI